MPTAGVLSRHGTRPHLLGEFRKKGSICANGMMRGMACDFLCMNMFAYSVGIEGGVVRNAMREILLVRQIKTTGAGVI